MLAWNARSGKTPGPRLGHGLAERLWAWAGVARRVTLWTTILVADLAFWLLVYTLVQRLLR